MKTIGICLRLDGGKISQYTNWHFYSIVYFNNKYVAFGPDGVFELGGDLDDTEQINAFFDTASTNLGVPNIKRIRKGYVEFEANGACAVDFTADEKISFSNTIEVRDTSFTSIRARLKGNRSITGRRWKARFKNLNGSDFTVRELSVVPIILSAK